MNLHLLVCLIIWPLGPKVSTLFSDFRVMVILLLQRLTCPSYDISDSDSMPYPGSPSEGRASVLDGWRPCDISTTGGPVHQAG